MHPKATPSVTPFSNFNFVENAKFSRFSGLGNAGQKPHCAKLFREILVFQHFMYVFSFFCVFSEKQGRMIYKSLVKYVCPDLKPLFKRNDQFVVYFFQMIVFFYSQPHYVV